MTPPTAMLVLLSYYLMLVNVVLGSIDAESWTKIAIPPDYWQSLNSSEEKAYGHRMACAVGCQLKGPTCKAFVFDEARSQCSFGDIVPTWPDNNYIPEYVMDGKEVSLRKSILKKKALTGINHLGYMGDEEPDLIKHATLERPDLMPVPIPLPIDPPYFAVETYENNIVVCGGKKPDNSGDKNCREWSFKTKQWRIIGEANEFHFQGASAILNDRLYLFPGLNSPRTTGSANRHVESLDLISGTFQQHADVSSNQDMYYVGAVALPHLSKILLANGREGNYFRDRSYFYDPSSDTYSEIDSGDVLITMSNVDCAIHPGDDNIVVCAGGWNSGEKDRVYLLNLTTEIFEELEDDSDKLPFGTVLKFFNVDSQLYAVAKPSTVLKYSEDGGPPRWTEVTNTNLMHKYGRNYAHTVNYHELLV